MCKGKRGAILMEMVQQREASSCCSPVAFGHFHGIRGTPAGGTG